MPRINGNFTVIFCRIHWIPVECYANLERRSNAADVWAMATTLYEIFTYGKEMPQTDHMQTKRVKYCILTSAVKITLIKLF